MINPATKPGTQRGRLPARLADGLSMEVKVAFRLFLLTCLFTGAAPRLRAQVLTGEIDGTVRDSSGAVVPQATVTVRNANERIVQRVVQTDGQGHFTVPLLAIGRYSLKIEANGFKISTVSGVEVHVGLPITVPVTLAVGNAAQSVTVTANNLAPELTTSAAGSLLRYRRRGRLTIRSGGSLRAGQIAGAILYTEGSHGLAASGAASTAAW